MPPPTTPKGSMSWTHLPACRASSCSVKFAAVDPTDLDPGDANSRERLQDAVGSAYRIGRLVGRGGFAEVYEAEEARLSRRVAIKVVHVDVGASPDVLVRFQREARAMAALRHPNVMEIYTVGEAAGLAYFVMPLVEGGSLKGRIERSGPLPLEEARRILIDAASALDAAHRSGTVHRDVKPDNILLEGGGARVLITDFGIAKALEADSSSFTRTGAFVGTPTYMSPEQAGGEEVDARSDIYSLGVVAFEMVTGRPPFEARSVQAMMAKHLTEAPPPVRSLRRECPALLARVVERCLAKDPGERWPSVDAMLEVLEAVDKTEGPTSIALSAQVASAPYAPVRALRRTASILLGLAVALSAMDLSMGLGGASAWAGAVAVGYLAVRAGRLWREGFGWRVLLLGPAVAESVPAPGADAGSAQDEGDFGRFGSLMRTVASDRAAILNAWASMYHQEQHRVRGLQPAVDGLVTRAKHLARRVVNLESRIAEAAARLERPASAVLDEAAAHELSPQVRRAARVHELGAARDDAARELRACVGKLEELRELLSDPTLISAGGLDEVARTVAEAEAYLSQRAI